MERVLVAFDDAGIAVDVSEDRLAAYSYDASNYRVRPLGVTFPESVEQVLEVVRICAATKTPLVGRGGGTSMAGNAIGPGIVVDFSRHLHRIKSVDTVAGLADVEPGVVLAALAHHVEETTHGRLTFAPDPSSRNRATIGGAIGNDACGNHSVRYGRTSDHIVELDLVTADGARVTAAAGGIRATDSDDARSSRRAQELENALRRLATENLAELRTELGRIPRQVSGYHLDNLLPERGFHVARALAGSEGTCALVVGARVALVPKAASALLVCLGYDDVVDAARDIPKILEFSPAAIEGIDQAIVDTMALRRGPDSVVGLPQGQAFLYVDLDGDSFNEVADRAEALLEELRGQGRLRDGRAVPDATERAALWRIREDGAGLSSRPATGGESWPGWEDSAVSVANLPDYLDGFRRLLASHGLTGIMYGHFGAGCMHIRVTYDLRTEAGRAVFRAFTRDAAELVVAHGGTLSGEHGDGRARSALLPLMYSPTTMRAFERFKTLWDPEHLLNPGSLVDADGFDENLALAGVPARAWRTSFELHPAEADRAGIQPWVHAVQSCIGVGRCRSDAGGVMCPSFRASGDERDSTRGRARALQDMIRNAPDAASGWASKDVRRTLDLCLSCKACSSDCPAGVDMATYKSEFFSHYYRRRLRPLSHLTLGWLPFWLKITGHMSGLVNALLRSPMRSVIAVLGGITPRRSLPRFAAKRELDAHLAPFRRPAGQPSTTLFVDSFTKGFRPEVAGAAARIASGAAGPIVCETDLCCGLPWISTGQLSRAKKVLGRAIDRLDRTGAGSIVVVEPSCAAALRKDAPELLQTDASRRVAGRIQSFADAVTTWVEDGWTVAGLPREVTVQTHCHEYATFGAAVQTKALKALGIEEIAQATGCCGVAGNFGFERDHYEMSMAVANQALVPALSGTRPEVPVLTDGFSCLMQVRHLQRQRRPLHLAELLDAAAHVDRAVPARDGV